MRIGIAGKGIKWIGCVLEAPMIVMQMKIVVISVIVGSGTNGARNLVYWISFISNSDCCRSHLPSCISAN